jgi:hypothetical protein
MAASALDRAQIQYRAALAALDLEQTDGYYALAADSAATGACAASSTHRGSSWKSCSGRGVRHRAQ